MTELEPRERKSRAPFGSVCAGLSGEARSHDSKGAPMPDDGTKTDSERKQSLAVTVTNLVAQGRRVESQSDFQAVLVRGRRPNHLMHMLLTFFTFFLWSIPWIVISLTGGEKRETVIVDEWGNVQVQRL